MPEPTTKAEILENMRVAHQDMARYLAALSDEQKTAPLLDAGWSVKDSLAHISAWETMALDWIARALQGEQVVRFAPGFEFHNDSEVEGAMNALNNHLYAQNKDRTWDDVQSEFRQLHRSMTAVVNALSEDDLFNPNRFAWRNGSPLLYLVMGNTYEHYAEHMDWLKNAFGSSG